MSELKNLQELSDLVAEYEFVYVRQQVQVNLRRGDFDFYPFLLCYSSIFDVVYLVNRYFCFVFNCALFAPLMCYRPFIALVNA